MVARPLPVMCFMLCVLFCFVFNSMGYCQDQVVGGCQSERLTLILRHSKTSRKRKAVFLLNAMAVCSQVVACANSPLQ